MFFPKKLLLQEQYKFTEGLFQTPSGWQELKMPQGAYLVKIHGAGGKSGGRGVSPSVAGGAGGAGGSGEYVEGTLTLYVPTIIKVFVGATGEATAAGGLGGISHNNARAGSGGAAGQPSFVLCSKKEGTFTGAPLRSTSTMFGIGASGGGGGGGGGAGGVAAARYGSGGGGGGGGGYSYQIWNLDEELPTIGGIPGKEGGSGTPDPAQSGTAGNASFPSVFSGAGSYGSGDHQGTPGKRATGGGASGAAGCRIGNSSNSCSGGGGGGAPGNLSAHGGYGGTGGGNNKGGNGYNASTTPDPTVDYQGNEVTTGWGTSDSDGWIYIKKIEPPLPQVIDYETPYIVDTPLEQTQYLTMPAGNYYVAVKSMDGGPLVEANTATVTEQTWSIHFEENSSAYIRLESGNSPRILWQSSGNSEEQTEGFIKIIQLADIDKKLDFGEVSEAATSDLDFGSIEDTATETENYGGIIK